MKDSSERFLLCLIITALVTMVYIPIEITKTHQAYYSILLIPVEFFIMFILSGIKRLIK